MKLQKIKLVLLIMFLIKINSKSRMRNRIKNEIRKNDKKSTTKFISNEGISLADVKFIINDKNQPKAQANNDKLSKEQQMSFKALNQRIIMIPDKQQQGPIIPDIISNQQPNQISPNYQHHQQQIQQQPVQYYQNSQGKLIDTQTYKSAPLIINQKKFDKTQEELLSKNNPYNFEKVQYKSNNKNQELVQTDSQLNKLLTNYANSQEQISKAKSSTFKVLDPELQAKYLNLKSPSENQSQSFRMKKITKSSQNQQLRNQMQQQKQQQQKQQQQQQQQKYQIQQQQQNDDKIGMRFSKQKVQTNEKVQQIQQNMGIIEQRQQQLNDNNYIIKSHLFGNVISAIDKGETQIVQKLTNPTTIQISEVKGHEVYSGTNNNPNIITAAIANSPIFQNKDTLTDATQEGLDLNIQNQKQMEEALNLLEQMIPMINDIDSLLEFTYKIRRVNTDIKLQQQQMKTYIVSNYQVTENLVKDIYDLKNKLLIMDNKDYNLNQLNQAINDTIKFKTQIKRMNNILMLFKDNDTPDENRLIDQMPLFVQNYCFINSQVYRVSNIIKIQSNDIPLIAIDKYLSQPRKLHLKNHLKTDSLSYNYEVLEKQENFEGQAINQLASDDIHNLKQGLTYLSNVSQHKIDIRTKKKIKIKAQVQDLIDHINHQENIAVNSQQKQQQLLLIDEKSTVDEEEDYIKQQFEQKQKEKSEQQVQFLIQQLKLKTKEIKKQGTFNLLDEDIAQKINQIVNESDNNENFNNKANTDQNNDKNHNNQTLQVDQATLFKQFILKNADKKKQKRIIEKIDKIENEERKKKK